jgi:DNA-binding NarL/FixJ family response regulator
VADDDDLYREGLALLFARDPSLRIVGRAKTVSEACDKARRLEPDVVLMELRLPDDGGLAAARAICQERPSSKVALIAKEFTRRDLVEAVNTGVRGYITKDVKLATLVDAIRTVARGDFFMPPQSSSILLQELVAKNGRETAMPAAEAERAKVTEREREVLQLLVQGATNRDIARRLSITENTVKVHLRNILDKLHLRNRQQAAAFAISSGLVRLHREEQPRRPDRQRRAHLPLSRRTQS